MIEMQIRRAAIEDAETLSRLNVDVQRLHAQALPQLFKTPESDGFALQFMREHLSDPHNYFFIARLDGEDIGYVFARLIDRPENPFMHAWKYITIDQISVQPAHQGQGCGSQLMEQVRTLARDEGIPTIALDTWSFNREAQDFFIRQGFDTFNLRMWRLEDYSNGQVNYN